MGCVSASLVIEGTGALYALDALPGLPEGAPARLAAEPRAGLTDEPRTDRGPGPHIPGHPFPDLRGGRAGVLPARPFRPPGTGAGSPGRGRKRPRQARAVRCDRRWWPAPISTACSAGWMSSRLGTPATVSPGRGSATTRSGLAALLELAHDLSDQPIGGCVWLVGTVGEEGLGNLRGMHSLVEGLGALARAYLVIEGMSLGNVYHRGLPARRLRIRVRTRGGHSWTHAGRPSAVHEIIRMAQRLLLIPLPSRPRTSLNLGLLEGGTAINAIAAQASLEVDLRSEDENIVAGLEAAVRLQAERSGVPPTYGSNATSIGSRPGGGIPADHPLVAAAVGACTPRACRTCTLEQARPTPARRSALACRLCASA